MRIDLRGAAAGALAQRAGVVEELGAVSVIQIELVVLDVEKSSSQIVNRAVISGRRIQRRTSLVLVTTTVPAFVKAP